MVALSMLGAGKSKMATRATRRSFNLEGTREKPALISCLSRYPFQSNIVNAILCDMFLCAIIMTLVLPTAGTNPFVPSLCVYLDRELRVSPRHHLEISLDQKSVVELSCGFRFTMLDVTNLRVNPYLYSRLPLGFSGRLLGLTSRRDQWRICVGNQP